MTKTLSGRTLVVVVEVVVVVVTTDDDYNTIFPTSTINEYERGENQNRLIPRVTLVSQLISWVSYPERPFDPSF